MENPVAQETSWIDRHSKPIKWVITIGCYAYLVYFLCHFEYYDEFAQRLTTWQPVDLLYLLGVLLLLPVNYGIEALKWYLLARHLDPRLTYTRAYRGIMVGLAAGFFTPNRIGEPLGRVLEFPAGTRLQGATRSLIGSRAQGIATCLFGLVALMVWFFQYGGDRSGTMIWAATAAALFIAVFLLLPSLSHHLIPRTRGNVREIAVTISEMDTLTWTVLLLLGCLRYLTYALQLYLMMLFFLVDLSALEALIAIPLNYLLVSVLPSVAFSEVGVRATCGTICLGPFTENVLGGALASAAVWLVNYVIPMLTGTLLTNKKRQDLQKP